MYYRGISHAFTTICRDEGFLGLYKGLGATLLVCSWCIFNSFYLLYVDDPAMSYNWHNYLSCVVQGVGPNIAISFSVYESLRSFWQSRRWISVFALNWEYIMKGVTSSWLVYIFVNIQSISLKFRPDDSTVMISLACGSLSGVASSTGKVLMECCYLQYHFFSILECFF